MTQLLSYQATLDELRVNCHDGRRRPIFGGDGQNTFGGDGQNTDPQSMDYPSRLPKWTNPKNNIPN